MKNQISTTERRLQEEVKVKPEKHQANQEPIENVNKQNSKPARQIKLTGLLLGYLIQLFESGPDRYLIQMEAQSEVK